MFLGHYGIALALKRAEPKVSLGTLFIATQLLDVVWGVCLLLGWEHVRILADPNPLLALQFYDYPISHSLVGAIGWGLFGAAAYYSWPTRNTTRHRQASLLVGAVVASHWLLDLIVHLPDLPLAGNDSAKVGLGLWRHLGLSVALELAVLAAGAAVYWARRSRRHPVRPARLAVVLLILVGIYLASIWSPPPPGVDVIGVTDVVGLLLLGLLGGWADRAATPAELAAQGAHPR
ncbi:MAG TPA: hypothetical protein VHR43_00895 [Gemmatimonadales bacterium]|jgi:hypothetical protein|nr:hypothetical protein [Gemmatimonadales bacterium]